MSDSFTSLAKTNEQATPESNEPKQENKPDQGGVEIEVGGKKYASIEDIQKKIENADSHISKIETENAEMRDKLRELQAKAEANQSIEELLSKLENKQAAKPNEAVDPEQIKQLINSTLSEKQQQDLQEQNWKECSEALIKHTNSTKMEEALPILKEKADSLGMTLEEVDNIARTKPALFKTVFLGQTSDQKPNVSTPKGSLNTENFSRNPAPQSNVVAPMNLRTTKERADNFEKALAEHLSSQR